ncbi:sigma-70 family RNA polymerase sigma factor [uncultured Proteiniphilum sp.]|uniref:RNA polymerase sigma factor n=1 Tax=uncultured Proteiniphilum sp. TaxID=497637 RepID=UPI00261BCB2D|nr:sigma-70 family RNA polymerase sigma factor [uncultured Proteiniphilum sp.]
MNVRQFQYKILCHSDKSYRLALSILKDESNAKDALQELMMRLWEKRNQLDAITNHQAFILTSMRNVCLDMIRKQMHTAEIPADTEYNAPDPHQQTEQTDMINHIGSMIDELPEMQRTILRMKDVEEMELEEIAQIMSMTENAVTVNLSRARKRLRDMIVSNRQKENTVYERYR